MSNPTNLSAQPWATGQKDSRLLDLWTLVLLVFPVLGTFFPPESYFAGGMSDGYTPGINLPITPVSLIFISLSVAFFYVRIRAVRPVAHCWLAYIYIAFSFMSIAWSPDPQLTFQRALRLLPPVGLGVVLPQFYSGRRLLKLLAIAFLISACASIFISVLVPSLGNGSLGNGYERAWRGALPHKNAAGFIYALGLLVILYAALAGVARWWLCLVAGAACAVMVIMAESATAILSAGVSVSAGMLVRWMRRLPPRVAMLGALVLALLVVLGLGIAIFAPEFLLGLAGRDMTLTGRTDLWDAVLELIPVHPIRGWEYGFWFIDTAERQSVWDWVGYKAAYSHNSWLDLLLQVGLIGMVPVALLCLQALVRTGWVAFEQTSPMATLYFAVIVFLIVRSNTEVEFIEPGISGLFWLVWAATAVSRTARSAQAPCPLEPARPFGALA